MESLLVPMPQQVLLCGPSRFSFCSVLKSCGAVGTHLPNDGACSATSSNCQAIDRMTDTAHRPVPFLDLKAQQARIAADLRIRLDRVLAHCQFILGRSGGTGSHAGKVLRRQALRRRQFRHDAIQIALMAEGIGRGDAVFLPAFTYTATAEVPLVLGASRCSSMSIAHFQIDPVHLDRRIADVRSAGKLRPAR